MSSLWEGAACWWVPRPVPISPENQTIWHQILGHVVQALMKDASSKMPLPPKLGSPMLPFESPEWGSENSLMRSEFQPPHVQQPVLGIWVTHLHSLSPNFPRCRVGLTIPNLSGRDVKLRGKRQRICYALYFKGGNIVFKL